MKHHIQISLLVFSIFLILCSPAVGADKSKKPSQINYRYYYFSDEYVNYYRFLPTPIPEGFLYQPLMISYGNIDDRHGNENIILIVVDTKPHSRNGDWVQAFLLITNTVAGMPVKNAVFKLFDTETPALDFPTAKSVELHNPPFALTKPNRVSFRLVDLTGDGTLDVWVESAHGVALISFQNGEFKEVLNNYTVTRQNLSETFDVEYYGYFDWFDPRVQEYHQLLANPLPKALTYNIRQKAIANIDGTPEKETIVLVTTQSGEDWYQAFLLIAENKAGVLKKKELFQLFDTGRYDLDFQGKTIELQNPPFIFRKIWRSNPWGYYAASFKLVDLTGDGILDIWAENAYGVAVISFQNGEFKEVCSVYSSSRRADPMEYIDIDNDGIYEIKIPDRIYVEGPTAACPEWVSLYEWSGTKYILNNKKFHEFNSDIYKKLLLRYKNYKAASYGRGVSFFDVHEFYLGLAHYYRGKTSMAQWYLQRVAEQAENEDYIKASESILKKLQGSEDEKRID